MRKNRDYTGLVRTPASMDWLLRERAQLQGRMDACRRQIEELPLRLVKLQSQIDALDNVFSLHTVQVCVFRSS
jgi:hypothetical protein